MTETVPRFVSVTINGVTHSCETQTNPYLGKVWVYYGRSKHDQPYGFGDTLEEAIGMLKEQVET